MSKLVFEAIGKYIHSTRYHQIVETESVLKLSPGEQDIMSRDQRHSSQVAKTHYQKLSSREIAEKAKHCFGKLFSSPSEKGCLRSDMQIPLKKCKPNDIQESCAGYHESHETSDEADSEYDEIFLTPVPKSDTVGVKQGERLPFTDEEDSCILKGLKMYRRGHWSSILRDSSFCFKDNRTADSIMKRALLLLSRKKKASK